MAKVRALMKGYVGGVLREHGEVFEWPEGNKVGSWVEPVAFGGKGDHDGDGLTGGSAPSDDGEKPKRGRGRAKAETVEAPEGEAFADAPAPETVKGNGVKEALGVAPDWIAPGSEVPEMAEE
ncbi:hypothetical protein GOC60_14710 [Sinorhizobium meliloti]|nr:hypothetical protein [Sinorhizobium meliloti]